MLKSAAREGPGTPPIGARWLRLPGVPDVTPVWCLYLIVGLIAIGVYFALPGIAQSVWYEGFGIAAVVAIAVSVRRHPLPAMAPWLLIALGLSLSTAGDIILNVYDNVLQVEAPYPNIADPFFLCGILAVSSALGLLVRRRVPGGDRGSLIDAAIIATGMGVLAWVFLMEPYFNDPALTVLQRLVAMAYPLMDVLMLTVAARLVFASGVRSGAFIFVGLALVAGLVTDVTYAELILTGNYRPGNPIDAGLLLWYVFWGAAALHPSMPALTDPVPMRQTHLPTQRLVLLAAAALLLPGARLLQWVRDEPVASVPIITAGSAIMFLLVLLRLNGLVQVVEAGRSKLERAVTREQTLRRAAAALVAATGRSGINMVAVDAAKALTDDPAISVRVALDTPDEPMPSADAGRHIDLADLPEPTRAALLAHRSTQFAREEQPALWEALGLDEAAGPAFLAPLIIDNEVKGAIVVAGDAPLPDETRGGLEALGSQVALALESAALAENLHQRQSEERFRALVQHGADLISILEPDGQIRYQTPSSMRVLGYRPEEMSGKSIFAFLHPDEITQAEWLLTELLRPAEEPITSDFRVRHADGSWRAVEAIASNLIGYPGVDGIVLTSRDISERKALEEQLAHQAFHDPLTDLPNRALFLDRLDHSLSRANRTGDPLAVLFLDLDEFKVINDSLGHKAGDQLLVAMAGRLQSCLRPGDTVARLGGDEFTVLLEDADLDQAVENAGRIARRLNAPIQIDGHDMVITTSVGIATHSTSVDRPDDLLRNADVALYAAKQNGKARYAIYDSGMQSRAWERLELEAELRLAVQRREFRVYYQPVMRLDTGRIVELEALVRWEHPERSLVPPDVFIPLAEETGMILPIGWWVLEEACRQVRAWQMAYPQTMPLTISVNLSARMFQHPMLVEDVARTLLWTGLEPASLTLEITETVMMQDGDGPITTLRQLKELGVQLAVDDFGTGYSSLAYLQRFPIGVLKIDRSFVSRLGQNTESVAIIRAIVGLAKTLNLEVIGEGIETSEQLDQLQMLGADRGQGYFLSRPLSGDDVDALLAGIGGI